MHLSWTDKFRMRAKPYKAEKVADVFKKFTPPEKLYHN